MVFWLLARNIFTMLVTGTSYLAAILMRFRALEEGKGKYKKEPGSFGSAWWKIGCRCGFIVSA
jgi:hypothetical protein